VFCALDGVTADANGRRLAQTGVRCLLHGFICQGAGTGHNADGTTLVDVAGHDADFASVWRNNTGAVWTDQAAIESAAKGGGT